MTVAAEIRTAFASSYKGGLRTFRARAYVADAGTKHTFIVALGDTPEEAVRDAIKYIHDRHIRDDVPTPQKIVNVGKLRGSFVDAWLF
jgi:hypothetical protein